MALVLAAIGVTAIAMPAAACLTPPPGAVEPPPPTPAQRAEAIYKDAPDIIYGVVTRGSTSPLGMQVRVLHVYKGGLRRGQLLAVELGHGFYATPCPGMVMPPPLEAGARGMIAFLPGPRVLRFVRDEWRDSMFEAGWIRRSRFDPTAQRVGTGSGPE